MASEITVVSNLTHTAFGSTVTAATTTDVVNDNTTTKRHSLIVQSVATGTAVAANVGAVATATQYWVRLRNLDTTIPNTLPGTEYVSVIVTASGVDTEIGRIYNGETWGPCRMRGVASGNPTLKLVAVGASKQVEVIAAETGDAN